MKNLFEKLSMKISDIIDYMPSFREARVTEEVVSLPPSFASLKGRTLLFVSDIHLSRTFTLMALRRLIHQIDSYQPDMLLLGGDYAESSTWQRQFFKEISAIMPPLGIYAVVGNNDTECFSENIDELRQIAAENGITLLMNESVRVRAGADYITIAGLDDFEYGSFPYCPLFDHTSASSLRILLSHYPQGAAYYSAHIDGVQPHLAFSGHTHGGQFSLCGITPFSVGFERRIHGMKLPAVSGWTNLKNTRLLVSDGIGTSRLPFRLCVPPVFHVIRL